jgi:nitrogenase molybdenum-iron protein alpha/beta subunit
VSTIESYGTPLNFPTLLGVYLAVNAIPDAFVLVDGPDCTLYKAHFIHGRHDLESTLLRQDGRHRVAFTNVCSRGVVKEHDETVRRHLRTLAEVPECGLVMATALPMCSITGVDYGRVIRSLGAELGKPAADIPPDSLVGDWLDGYAQTLTALVRAFAPGKDRRRPGTAAVVGYMMDRNEADHRANLAELRRMLAAVGLEAVSFWLGGEKSSELRRAEEADVVVSLPYGRAAARRLAKATGAKLVETVLPFGLPRCERFVRDAAKASGRPEAAEAFIDAELARVIPRLKSLVPHLFVNRRAAFMGDPHLMEGFFDIAEELGISVEGAIARGRAGHGGARECRLVLHEPPASSPEVRALLRRRPDVFVSCWWEKELGQVESRTVEFGFPSYRHHALYESPFLGFDGFLAFTERLADAVFEAERERRGR